MQEQRYVYFQEISAKRQFHTATELAQDLTDIYRITTLTDKVPSRLVSAYLNNKLDERGLPRLYSYNTKGKMIQVFQNEMESTNIASDILFINMRTKREKINPNKIQVKVGNKNFYVKVPENSGLLPPTYHLKDIKP